MGPTLRRFKVLNSQESKWNSSCMEIVNLRFSSVEISISIEFLAGFNMMVPTLRLFKVLNSQEFIVVFNSSRVLYCIQFNIQVLCLYYACFQAFNSLLKSNT